MPFNLLKRVLPVLLLKNLLLIYNFVYAWLVIGYRIFATTLGFSFPSIYFFGILLFYILYIGYKITKNISYNLWLRGLIFFLLFCFCVFLQKCDFHASFVVPMWVPCDSLVSPIFRPFLGTDLQWTWNGLGTEVERTMKKAMV